MGGAIAVVAEQLGQALMPWQRLVADVGGELDERTGLPAFREVVITIPRQSGKTSLVLAWEVQRALGWGRAQRVAYTAQTGWDARKKLIDDQAPVLLASLLAPTVRQVIRGAGNEGVVFENGSRIDVMASTDTAGHGRTVDLGVIDEAFSDTDPRREQALLPAMATRASGQLLVPSTAGTDSSVYLRRKVDVGRAAAAEGRRSGVAYFEWSAGEDDDPDDEAVWWSCMPALGYTITVETVRHARQTMTDGEFRRAFLNQWTRSDERVIPLVAWEAVQRSSGQAEPAGKLVYAVDVNPDRSAAAVCVAGAGVCEVVAYQPGTAWAVPRVVESVGRWGGSVVVDVSGPAGGLVSELERGGVKVHAVKSGDMAKACGGFYDAIADAKVEILRHDGLDAAVAGAVKRPVGDAWVWARKTASADVCPLVAVTAAWWVSQSPVPSAGFKNLADYLEDGWEDD